MYITFLWNVSNVHLKYWIRGVATFTLQTILNEWLDMNDFNIVEWNRQYIPDKIEDPRSNHVNTWESSYKTWEIHNTFANTT